MQLESNFLPFLARSTLCTLQRLWSKVFLHKCGILLFIQGASLFYNASMGGVFTKGSLSLNGDFFKFEDLCWNSEWVYNHKFITTCWVCKLFRFVWLIL